MPAVTVAAVATLAAMAAGVGGGVLGEEGMEVLLGAELGAGGGT